MKRIIASLVIGVSALSGQAFALVGGPFDNNSHSAALDRLATYQAVLSFPNGSGYVYFNPGQLIASENPALPTAFSQKGSSNNRSVVYYKGITYVGGAFGMVDIDARYVQADINGSSDVAISAATTSTQSNFFTFSQNTTSVSSSITSSGRSYVNNGNFEGRITQTSPILRFRGKGEMAFLSPTGPDTVASVAYNGYNNLILQIGGFFTSVNNVIVGTDIFGDAAKAIDNALLGLKNQLASGGIDVTLDNSDIVKMKVKGSRRYF
jgi:hypothetical protein